MALPSAAIPPLVGLGPAFAPEPLVHQRPPTALPESSVFEGRERIPRRRPLQLLDDNSKPIEPTRDGCVRPPTPRSTRTEMNGSMNGSMQGSTNGSLNHSADSTPQARPMRPATLILRAGSPSAFTSSSTRSIPPTLFLRPPPGTAPARIAPPSSDHRTSSPEPTIRARPLGNRVASAPGAPPKPDVPDHDPAPDTSSGTGSDRRGKRKADFASFVRAYSSWERS
jgi:hypothetical protein